MAKRKKAKKVSTKTFHETVLKLLKRHKKVRMLFREGEELDQQICECMCKKCIKMFHDIPDYGWRHRLIDRKGNVSVSYKGSDYRKFSRYSTSCFMDDYDEKYGKRDVHDGWNSWSSQKELERVKKEEYSPSRSLKFMSKHDRDDGEIYPVEIHYGPKFKRKITL